MLFFEYSACSQEQLCFFLCVESAHCHKATTETPRVADLSGSPLNFLLSLHGLFCVLTAPGITKRYLKVGEMLCYCIIPQVGSLDNVSVEPDRFEKGLISYR